MIVKICGLRTEADVAVCTEAGADMVGFNLWEKSPRYVPLDTARELAGEARAVGLQTVALVVGPEPAILRAIDALPEFDWIQPYRLPEGERPQCSRWLEPCPVGNDLSSLSGEGHRLLIETAVPQHGGSGKRFDWNLLRNLRGVDRVMVAGGIRPDNVTELLGIARPWGIDVASGVESRPGLKDPEKIRTLIQIVRQHVSDSSTTA